MSIDLKYLENEKKTLTNDFENTKLKIKETESALAQLKGNLNAVYGAIQQNDKMIMKFNDSDKDQAKKLAQV